MVALATNRFVPFSAQEEMVGVVLASPQLFGRESS
jgi:hypothetical protein